MEIKVGVQNVAREIVLESAMTTDEVASAVDAALGGAPSLRLTDDKGRVLLVPTASLAYVEIGVEETRKVGFGVS
ncbi:DUF3107 domain-containing protein [Thalassiella azotivora]